MNTTEVVLDRAGTRLVADRRPGTGKPVVLLHGAMADARAWREVTTSVVTSRPLLIPNRRGRAPSGSTGAGYSVQSEVDDLRAWLDELDDEVDVVAHSYGGLIAIETAAHDERISSLTLYEPVVRPFASTALPAITRAAENCDLDALVTMVNVDISGYPPSHVAALRESPVWHSLRELARPLAEELAAINGFAPDLRAWGALEIPVTLIAGELSANRRPYGDALERIQAALDISDVQILPGQDHLAHVTSPKLLASRIDAALGH